MPEAVTGAQNTEGQQGQTGQTQQTGQQTGQQQTGQQTGQTTQQTGQQQSGQQRPGAGDTSGWDRERAGFLADLKKEREARQAAERRSAELTGTLTTEQKRVRALAGLEVKSEQDQEIEQVRERLLQVFPVLGKLTEEKLTELLGLNEKVGSVEQVANHHWERHGQTMLDSLAEAVSDGIGKDLTERQRKQLYRAYVAEAESNPEFLKRHEAGDSKLTAEFAKEWIEDWLESARSKVVTDEVSRRPRVPNGRDRNVSTTPPKKIDFKDNKAVEDAMVESFRSHGGRFDA